MVKQKDTLNKCINLLLANGWKFADGDDEYLSYNKDGCISVDLSEEYMVFIGESGDFLHEKTNYFTLIGVLIHHRQLPIDFKQLQTIK